MPDVAALLTPLLSDEITQKALEHLSEDFLDPDGIGPRRVAEFLYGRPDPETQADVTGFVRQLLGMCMK
ncbi:MAG: hypothetical protein WCS65_18295 [Verrucomicrobiae bacterium]